VQSIQIKKGKKKKGGELLSQLLAGLITLNRKATVACRRKQGKRKKRGDANRSGRKKKKGEGERKLANEMLTRVNEANAKVERRKFLSPARKRKGRNLILSRRGERREICDGASRGGGGEGFGSSWQTQNKGDSPLLPGWSPKNRKKNRHFVSCRHPRGKRKGERREVI